MNFVQAIILAIVEGLTEFLPVSSTGHMIICSSFMGIESQAFTKMFTVVIQLGAILSVVVVYWQKFLKIDLNFYKKLIFAFIPSAVFAILLKKHIDKVMESALIVGIALFIGGILFLALDKWIEGKNKTGKDDLPSDKSSVIVGLFQILAMLFPGTSRSAATIIGGLTQNLTKRAAAEFSFFLAVPTMGAATVKELYDYYKDFGMPTSHEIKLLALGNIIAFIVALIAIKSFINILTKYGFKVFGWYRIAAGGIIIILYLLGYQLSVL
ncbi:MAG TPA: undecaprenyl-diphosphate phosphatase [Bacteroidia bacterium]|jgi:undecaprenyl-diphosphatase|nr:undecaprenyl-diphosphate phosphatase [Bacteroidia bacterium]